MLRKYSTNRTLAQNIRLGSLTAFSAGMVNVASLMAFYAFTSNITGHVSVLAEEVVKGHWFQVFAVAVWMLLFFLGSFISNSIVIHYQNKNLYIAHALPIFIEFVCLLIVAIYGHFYYQETLTETECLVAFLLFAMGIQNGLTASISNGVVKTTHLTGLFTDAGIAFSMLTSKRHQNTASIKDKLKLLSVIFISYLTGGILGGFIFLKIQFLMFLVTCLVLLVVLTYDFYSMSYTKFSRRKTQEEGEIEDFLDNLAG